jgi:hypothetical protein
MRVAGLAEAACVGLDVILVFPHVAACGRCWSLRFNLFAVVPHRTFEEVGLDIGVAAIVQLGQLLRRAIVIQDGSDSVILP